MVRGFFLEQGLSIGLPVSSGSIISPKLALLACMLVKILKPIPHLAIPILLLGVVGKGVEVIG
ncbi:hypothetical protein GCM10025791_17230 [Halioxenophilus aromaticivorans]|uniref:Uncharacterized protein n=1 Tax=Halioxenophilus aromaticivorans TaxID=1306992 RepID=A0AAV3U0Y2_9ALTE